MKVLVSGQAGLAAIIDGDDVKLMNLSSPDPFAQVHAGEIPYWFADANDLEEMHLANMHTVATALGLASRKDRALQLLLVSIDSGEDDQTVEVAAEDLEILFQDDQVRAFVRNRLYGAPLPAIAYVHRARHYAERRPFLAGLLAEICENQNAIQWYCTTWDDIGLQVFGGERQRALLRRVAIDIGLFQALALANEDNDRVAEVLSSHRGDRRLLEFACAVDVINEWSDRILCSRLRDALHHEVRGNGEYRHYLDEFSRSALASLCKGDPDGCRNCLEKLGDAAADFLYSQSGLDKLEVQDPVVQAEIRLSLRNLGLVLRTADFNSQKWGAEPQVIHHPTIHHRHVVRTNRPGGLVGNPEFAAEQARKPLKRTR